jgi:hypothetical protein
VAQAAAAVENLDRDTPPAAAAAEDAPPAVATSTGDSRPAESGKVAPARKSARWAAGLILLAVGIGTGGFLIRGGLKGSRNPAVVSAATGPAPGTAQPKPSGPPPPTWVGRTQAMWAGDGSKTIAFSVEAIRDVSMRTHRERPRLVVRCLSHVTDVYVETGSASIEPDTDMHTVRVQFDEEPERVEHWADSASRQELFAPDGLALARRLSHSKTMRFRFVPYNAAPAVADFAVVGFDRLVGYVAATCGWRSDAGGQGAIRR